MGTQLELAEESEEDESGDEEDEWDSQDEDTGLISNCITYYLENNIYLECTQTVSYVSRVVDIRFLNV